MDRLREDLNHWQGMLCAMPNCENAWVDVAHIHGSGMGGRISTYSIENVVGLCRPCHDTFDGRDLQGRQLMLRDLLSEWVRSSRAKVEKQRLAGF